MSAHNTTQDGEGFYVSHNNSSFGRRDYGGETTALVIGQFQRFYVLMGDHRKAYASLIPSGLTACVEYYKRNQSQRHQYSNVMPELNEYTVAGILAATK